MPTPLPGTFTPLLLPLTLAAALTAALEGEALPWTPPSHYRIATRAVPTAPSRSFFTRALGLDFDERVVRRGTDSTVSRTDDTPLDLVNLPFPFRYFSERVSSVWLNPNGGLQFHAKPPCGCCFSAMLTDGRYCDFNTSYYDTLAGAVTDLIPVELEGSIVRYAALGFAKTITTDTVANTTTTTSTANVSDPGFGIAFVGIPIFGLEPSPGPLYSFGVVLRKSGRITIAYENIYDTRNDLPGYTHATHVHENWLVGLRPPKEYAAALRDTLGPEFCTNSDDYGTGVCGSYPPASKIVPGAVVDYCPAPTTICVEPSWALWGSETKIRIRGSSHFACLSPDDPGALAVYCRFGSHPVITPASLVNGTESREIECKTPPDRAGVAPLVGSVRLDLVYNDSSGPDGVLTALPFRNENLFMFTNTAPAPDTCNPLDPSPNRACDICGECVLRENTGTNISSYTCAVNTCDGKLDSQLDCSGACNGLAVTDARGTCCPSAAMLDCEGICNGTSVTATVIYPTTVARGCCPASRVDCDGVCAGTANLDRCGICAGGRTGKKPDADLDCLGLCPNDPRQNIPGRNASCDPIVDITPATIDFSVPHDASATQLQRTFPIKVSNNGPISVYLMDLIIRNHYEFPEKSAGQTLPLVEVSQNLTVAEWGSGKVFEVPAQTTAELLVRVDMRSSLESTTSFNEIPLRKKGIAFVYSYSGPQAKKFGVLVPINVSRRASMLGIYH